MSFGASVLIYILHELEIFFEFFLFLKIKFIHTKNKKIIDKLKKIFKI